MKRKIFILPSESQTYLMYNIPLLMWQKIAIWLTQQPLLDSPRSVLTQLVQQQCLLVRKHLARHTHLFFAITINLEEWGCRSIVENIGSACKRSWIDSHHLISIPQEIWLWELGSPRFFPHMEKRTANFSSFPHGPKFKREVCGMAESMFKNNFS